VTTSTFAVKGGAAAVDADPASASAAAPASRRITAAERTLPVVLSLLAAAVACTQLAGTGGSTQAITVEAASHGATSATLRTWTRAGGCWRPAAGPYPARVGRNGLSADRREGDGTTPVGSFGIAPRMYGTERDPGVRFRYHRLVCGDWWNEDPASPTYNSFRHVACGTRPAFWNGSEGMWQQPRAYAHLAVVEFNMHPVVPGRGSGIFLHATTGRATNGCISLRRVDLVRVLRWLRPAARPRIVIGTRGEVRVPTTEPSG
jgi:L,D-peptidoglycan transpeptidase YkuD (ErfK/YbiS/YcfS/YnhG family)